MEELSKSEHHIGSKSLSSSGSHLRLRVQTGRPEHKARLRTLDECQLEQELEFTQRAVAPQT